MAHVRPNHEPMASDTTAPDRLTWSSPELVVDSVFEFQGVRVFPTRVQGITPSRILALAIDDDGENVLHIFTNPWATECVESEPLSLCLPEMASHGPDPGPEGPEVEDHAHHLPHAGQDHRPPENR